jgi:hypothetical protein
MAGLGRFLKRNNRVGRRELIPDGSSARISLLPAHVGPSDPVSITPRAKLKNDPERPSVILILTGGLFASNITSAPCSSTFAHAAFGRA